MLKLAINTFGDELESSAEYCRAEGLGLELNDFALPRYLDDRRDDRISHHVDKLHGIEQLASHGPCFDLAVTSIDSAIVDVCRKRHKASLDAAYRIGAKLYVAHTNFNAMIKHPNFLKKFAERTVDFWLPFADEAGKHGVTICIENTWDPDPNIQMEIVTIANHPYIKASFDNGHALVYSGMKSAEWIKILGPQLVHLHLHDNDGQFDQHIPVGDGIENWSEVIDSIKTHAPNLFCVLETEVLEKNRTSVEKFREFYGAAS